MRHLADTVRRPLEQPQRAVGLIRQQKAVAIGVGHDAAEAELATADGVRADTADLGKTRQGRCGVSVQAQSAADVRGGHQRDVETAIAVEVTDAEGIQPAIGLAEKRRHGFARDAIARHGVDRQRGAACRIGLHDQDLVLAVPIEIGQSRRQILENPRRRQRVHEHPAAAGLDGELRGLDAVAENGVVVSGRGTGKPCGGDVRAAARDMASGQLVRSALDGGRRLRRLGLVELEHGAGRGRARHGRQRDAHGDGRDHGENRSKASAKSGCQRDSAGRLSIMSPAAQRMRWRSISGVVSSSGHRM